MITGALNHVAHAGAEALGKYLKSNDGGGDPGDRLLRMKLAEQMSKKHGGTIKDWYKKLGEQNFGKNVGGNGMGQIELAFNLTSALGLEGSIGLVSANDGVGAYYSIGPSFGHSFSLGINTIFSNSILDNTTLSISDVNGTSISKGLGLGVFNAGWGNNTTSIPNTYAYKNIPTLRYWSAGLSASIGPPVSFTYSMPYTYLFLKF